LSESGEGLKVKTDNNLKAFLVLAFFSFNILDDFSRRERDLKSTTVETPKASSRERFRINRRLKNILIEGRKRSFALTSIEVNQSNERLLQSNA